VQREWDATILEQVPDRKAAWAATTGTTNAGSVYFEPRGPEGTGARLVLEYAPEGFVEKVGTGVNIVSRQAQSDLEKFKEFIEDKASATGTWRGTVRGVTPHPWLPRPDVVSPDSLRRFRRRTDTIEPAGGDGW
jgi:hypothetical protein